jgi:hypothetical protein
LATDGPFSILEAEQLIPALHHDWGEAQGTYDEFRSSADCACVWRIEHQAAAEEVDDSHDLCAESGIRHRQLR